MANGKSDWAQSLLDAKTKRNVQPVANRVQRGRHTAIFTVTLLGTEGAAGYHELGPLLIPGARIIPEECRLRFGGTGTMNFTAKINKVDKDGASSVDLTATTSAVTAATAAITFAAAGGGERPLLAKDDVLRLTFPDGTTTTAGRILYVEVAYDVDGR